MAGAPHRVSCCLRPEADAVMDPIRTPPAAPREPFVSNVHGQRRVDEYHWLREKDSQRVRAHLEAENAYTDGRDGAYRRAAGGAVPGNAGAHPGNRHGGALPRRSLRVLLPHRAGQELPDFVPAAAGEPGRAGHPGPERDGAGARLLRAGGLRGQRRRRSARVFDRRHRLPRIYAAGEGPAFRRAVAFAHREGQVGGLGERQPHPVLRGRGRGEARVPSLPPSARNRPPRAALRGDRRAFLDRHRPVAQPRLPVPHLAQRHHLRGALSERRSSLGQLRAGRAAPSGARILPGPSRRSLLHRDQRPRAQLPPGDGAGSRPARAELVGGDRASRGRDAGRRGPVRRALRAARAARRLSTAAGSVLRERRGARGAVSRACLRRARRREHGVRHARVPLRVRVAGHARLGVRLRHGRAQPHPAQAASRARRLRSGALRLGAHVRQRTRRRAHSRVDGVPPRSARSGTAGDAAHRVRRLRLSPRRALQLGALVAARSRRHRRRGPRARRRRDGQALARRRTHAQQAQYLHRLHRGGRALDRRPDTRGPRSS